MRIAYLDESGIESKDEVLVVAAVMADVDTWSALSKKWSDVLASYRQPAQLGDTGPGNRTLIFHATDCEGGRGDFRRLSIGTCDSIRRQLIRCAVGHRFEAAVISVAHCDLLPVLKAVPDSVRDSPRDGRRFIRHPYYFGLTALWGLMDKSWPNLSAGAGLQMVSERQALYADCAERLLRYAHQAGYHRSYTLTFDRHQYPPPMQLADFVAYEFYRHVKNPSAQRWPLQKLMMWEGVTWQLHWQHLDAPSLRELAERLRDVAGSQAEISGAQLVW